jgi:hypothetical protein
LLEQVAKKDKATLPEMKGALSELSMAERTFQHLASLSTKVPHTRLNFNPKKAEKHVAQCQVASLLHLFEMNALYIITTPSL